MKVAGDPDWKKPEPDDAGCQVLVVCVEPVVDDGDADPGAERVVPGLLGADVGADGAAELAGVAPLPLLAVPRVGRREPPGDVLEQRRLGEDEPGVVVQRDRRAPAWSPDVARTS